jgi:dihydroxyacetone kinase
MSDSEKLLNAFKAIATVMAEQKTYLVELDQRNGDGDLGISMADGFAASCSALWASSEKDLGKLCICAGKAFNEAAPSSLGTIISLCLMGMARTLKGHEESDMALLGEALNAGMDKVMDKAGSKPGEKTILDSVCPAIQAITENADKDEKTVLEAAAKAASDGAKSTADMIAVHGRAAYFGEKSIGLIDGGAEVGRIIFETLAGL